MSEYRLFLCDQETGREGMIDSGGRKEMISRMEKDASYGRDVWVVSPEGQKHLPQDQRKR